MCTFWLVWAFYFRGEGGGDRHGALKKSTITGVGFTIRIFSGGSLLVASLFFVLLFGQLCGNMDGIVCSTDVGS